MAGFMVVVMMGLIWLGLMLGMGYAFLLCLRAVYRFVTKD
jgi:hypothetical protein